MTSVELVVDARNQLGEGATWDVGAAALWWFDIVGHRLHRLDIAGGLDVWELEAAPGALACTSSRVVLVALASGVATFDPESGAVTPIVDPEPGVTTNRLNDGATDRMGRFWFGSMDAAARGRTGGLYRLDPDGSVTQHATGVGIPNSLAFSPDGETMYFAETLDRTIFAFDYDLESGTPHGRRVFASVPEPGFPDGSTVDAAGCLWNAEWGGSRIVRYTPDGAVDRVIETPVTRPSSCVFGGTDLSTLFVTSAGGHQGASGVLDGGVFAVEVGEVGLADTVFG